MKILLLGSGGREHALAWKLRQSDRCSSLFIAPGNAGTAGCGTNINIAVNDFEGIKSFIKNNEIELLVVGPEEPLVKGIRDFMQADADLVNLMIIGPGEQAAQLEGSKDFSKAFMQRHHIPTAAYRTFEADNFEEGIQYLQQHTLPIVLKADGLAAGKGVVICATQEQAIIEFTDMIREQKFGAASARVVVEEFLTGIEMSIFVLTDGKNFVILPEAKDYKKIGEGETGLNTGGMGAVSPVPFYDAALKTKVISEIVAPTVNGLAADDINYSGIIFIGLIVEQGAAKVIEYNCRLGDPETEVVLMRLENDLVNLFEATALQKLDSVTIKENSKASVGVVAVSGGYPGVYQKNISISLPQKLEEDSILFHAGTSETSEGIVTNGGRVLVAVSQAKTISEAADKSFALLDEVMYEGKYSRRDIGFEFG